VLGLSCSHISIAEWGIQGMIRQQIFVFSPTSLGVADVRRFARAVADRITDQLYFLRKRSE
jgi:hypothetical protein